MNQAFLFILNVISPEADTLAAPLRELLAELSTAGEMGWLSRGYAFDIAFDGDAPKILHEARLSAGNNIADINILPYTNRRKKLLLADMDSTLIGCEVLDEIADFAGIKAETAAVTERAMHGEIEFAPSLRERLALLKGLPLDCLAQVYDERVRINPGAHTLVATMKAHGAYTMLVSGGFTYFTSRVADNLGFHEHRGNILLDNGETLSGAAAEPILGREAKLDALRETTARLAIDLFDTLTVGDGANDLDMICAAGLGVAWHAKPIVAKAATARIDHADLKGLLYLQGYRDDEIVAR